MSMQALQNIAGRRRAHTASHVPMATVDEDSIEVDEAADKAAVQIQRHARGHMARCFYEERLVSESEGALSMDIAEEKAAAQVQKGENGQWFDLKMSTERFGVFGEAVVAYMFFVYRGAHLFLFCFLLSISNTFTFIEGSDMGSAQTPISSMSLGNADFLKPSCAFMEFVISGVLVYFLYWSRTQQLKESQIAREETCTPADFTVMISGLPANCTSAEDFAKYLKEIDEQLDALAVTISFNYRDLIQCVEKRDALMDSKRSYDARKVLVNREIREINDGLRAEEVKLRKHSVSRPFTFFSGLYESGGHQEPVSPPKPSSARAVKSFSTPPSIASFGRDRLNYSGVGEVVRKRGDLERNLRRSQRSKESIQKKVDGVQKQIQELNKKIGEMVYKNYECTGFAFVTFNEESAAKACLYILNSQKIEITVLPSGQIVRTREGSGFESGSGNRIRGERPPEPEEVYWDQLQFKHPELVRRQIIAIAGMMCVALAGTVVICIANYGMGPVMASANSLASRIGMQVFFTVLIILGNIFIFILTPIVAHKYERHYTFGGKELSCFCKMVGFQVFNTVVASTVFFFFSDSLTQARHSWYEYGSSMVLNVLIGDIFVINLGIDLGQPGQLITKYLQAPHAKTQRELNSIITSSRNADIYLAFRLQLVVKIIVICLIYSGAIPICYLLTSFFMLLSMWIDRYNLLRRLKPPPRSPDALISLVLSKILPATIAVHLATNILYYQFQWWVMFNDPICDTSSKAWKSFDTSGSNVPFNEDGTRCQTAHAMLQAQTAVLISWFSLLFWGIFLMYFVRRDRRKRRVDTRARGLQPDDIENRDFIITFADIFIIPDAPRQVLAETKTNPFRREREEDSIHLYTPPLPLSIVEQVGSCHNSKNGDTQTSLLKGSRYSSAKYSMH